MLGKVLGEYRGVLIKCITWLKRLGRHGFIWTLHCYSAPWVNKASMKFKKYNGSIFPKSYIIINNSQFFHLHYNMLSAGERHFFYYFFLFPHPLSSPAQGHAHSEPPANQMSLEIHHAGYLQHPKPMSLPLEVWVSSFFVVLQLLLWHWVCCPLVPHWNACLVE